MAKINKKLKQQQGYSIFSIAVNKKNKNNVNTVPFTEGAIIPPSLPNPNNTISLSTNKTDEETISTPKYGFSIDWLVNSSTTRRARKLEKIGGNPPRPQNSYILYMRANVKKPEYQNLPAKEKMKIISECWKRESEDVKNYFEACARMSKKIHSERYGDYRFKPSKNQQKKIKRIKNTENTDGRCNPIKTEPNLTDNPNLSAILLK